MARPYVTQASQVNCKVLEPVARLQLGRIGSVGEVRLPRLNSVKICMSNIQCINFRPVLSKKANGVVCGGEFGGQGIV
jgi:hypothetical protein